MIHVMAVTGLGGAAVSAPVVGYDTIALLEEEQHLRVPIIRRQRPAVGENNRLTRSPILVVDLCSIFGRNCRHGVLSLITASSFGRDGPIKDRSDTVLTKTMSAALSRRSNFSILFKAASPALFSFQQWNRRRESSSR